VGLPRLSMIWRPCRSMIAVTKRSPELFAGSGSAFRL
jgi:hypothetical protein